MTAPTADDYRDLLGAMSAEQLQAECAAAIRANRLYTQATRRRCDLCWYECWARGQAGEALYRAALVAVQLERREQARQIAEPLPWEKQPSIPEESQRADITRD